MRRNYGTGSLTIDKTVNRISARIRINGKTIKKTFPVNQMQKAEAWLKEMSLSPKIKKENYNLKTYLELYIKNFKENIVRGRSLERIKQSAKKWEALYSLPIDRLTSMQIQEEINAMVKSNLSPSSIKKSAEILKKALNQAVIDNLIPINPALSITLPAQRETERIDILTKKEIGKVFHALRKIEHNRRNTSQRYDMILFFRLLLYCGMRVSELLCLTWDDVNDVDNLLYIHGSKEMDTQEIQPPKTPAGFRYVPILNKKTRDMLYKHKDGHSYIFQNKNGGMMNYQRAFKTWQNACRMAKVNKNIHTLRHTCISHMLTYCQIPLPTVSEIAGHKNSAITLAIYTHAIKEYKLKQGQISGQIEKPMPPKIRFY